MSRINDVSRAHRTELSTTIQVGRRRYEVRASVPGRDVWAYQMAKIQLQNAVLAHQRAARPDGARKIED
jgi:hypothetical protein